MKKNRKTKKYKSLYDEFAATTKGRRLMQEANKEVDKIQRESKEPFTEYPEDEEES
jgi:hypothetical protein